jgi:hypothetical protein
MKQTEKQKAAWKEHKRLCRETLKETATIAAKKAQRPIKEITINIEWSKSRTWGSNPNATANVTYKDASPSGDRFKRQDGYTCSGCGYDKESTVIAQVYNAFLAYKLFGKIKKIRNEYNRETGATKKVYPYGISILKHKAWKEENGTKHIARESRYFDGGIGTNCYYDISKAIGGKFEHVASGKMFDAYKYTDN